MAVVHDDRFVYPGGPMGIAEWAELSREDQQIYNTLHRIAGDDHKFDFAGAVAAMSNRVLSKQTVMSRLGFDYEEEMAKLKDELCILNIRKAD